MRALLVALALLAAAPALAQLPGGGIALEVLAVDATAHRFVGRSDDGCWVRLEVARRDTPGAADPELAAVDGQRLIVIEDAGAEVMLLERLVEGCPWESPYHPRLEFSRWQRVLLRIANAFHTALDWLRGPPRG